MKPFVLITGSSSGIGKAIAINLSKKYSEESVVKMLNGVLDKIYHEEDKDAE